MNRLKVFGIFLLLAITNIFIIKEHNLMPLLIVSIVVYSASLYLNLHQEIIKRIKLFFFLGIFILLFQFLFNQAGSVTERIFLGFRVVLQLATISESVFMVMKLISPAEIVESFDFLPKSIQILLSMTFYFIPLLIKEYDTIQLVQQSRRLGSTFFSRSFSPIYIFVPLLHRIFQRSETITYTILSRGWREV